MSSVPTMISSSNSTKSLNNSDQPPSPLRPTQVVPMAEFTEEERARIDEISRLGSEIRERKKNKNNDGTKTTMGDAIVVDLSTMIEQMNRLKTQISQSVMEQCNKLLCAMEDDCNEEQETDEMYNQMESETLHLCTLLPSSGSNNKKKVEKRIKSLRKNRDVQISQRFDRKLHTVGLRIQRKIPHLLVTEGGGGGIDEEDDGIRELATSTFRYIPHELATDRHGMKENDMVVMTEKWDGTTAQATNRGVFKRFDLFSRGDPAKFAAKKEEDRYYLSRLNVGFDDYLSNRRHQRKGDGGRPHQSASHDDPTKDQRRSKKGATSGARTRTREATMDKEHQYIRAATYPYFDAFAKLDDGVCVYFEAVGTKIQSRYRQEPPTTSTAWTTATTDDTVTSGERDGDEDDWHDIRVFDFARDGTFLPWEETCSLANKYGLPLVGHRPPAPLNLSDILEELSSNTTCYENCPLAKRKVELEGFVIRGVVAGSDDGEAAGGEEEPIAKIRVEDISRMDGEKAEGGQ